HRVGEHLGVRPGGAAEPEDVERPGGGRGEADRHQVAELVGGGQGEVGGVDAGVPAPHGVEGPVGPVQPAVDLEHGRGGGPVEPVRGGVPGHGGRAAGVEVQGERVGAAPTPGDVHQVQAAV